VEIRDLEQPLTSYADRQGAIRYLQAFRRHWPLIVLLVVVTVGVTGALTLNAPKKYKATSDLQVNPIPVNSSSLPQGAFDALFYQPADGSSVVVTVARVMNSPDLRNAALDRVGTRRVSFSVTPLSQADIIAVTATARSAQLAADAANAFVNAFVDRRTAKFSDELNHRISDLQKRINAIPVTQRPTNVEASALQQQVANYRQYLGGSNPSLQALPPGATPPTSPSSPRPKLSMAVAFVAALLLGCGLAVAREFFNPRLTDEDELRLGQRLPILARIPRLRERAARAYLSGRGVLPSEAWKGYRTLRAVLATVGERGGYPRSILVTSAGPGDGKTMTAVNLAISLAAADLRVVLVDADFHRPMIGSIFNVSARPYSLTRLLLGDDAGDEVLVSAPSHPGLRLLVSSREHSTHLHRLDTARFRSILEQLAKDADVVVVDSPPLPEVAETLAMADAVEAVLINVRLGHTRRDKLEQLRELLARRGIAPLGFVVVPRSRSDATDSYYGYAEDVPAPPASEPARVAKLSQPKVIRAIDQ
jgi:capsular exopolysaccharide synthesis family protein